MLATSQEALGIPGETVLPVGAMADAEALQLFADRAAERRPGFALTDANYATVTAICRRLDGIPLAIELAAGRVAALSVEEIADLLNDQFRLLTGGSRAAMARQQTLRATVDWSYNLLEPDEQTLFARLAAFSGGWNLDAAVGGRARSATLSRTRRRRRAWPPRRPQPGGRRGAGQRVALPHARRRSSSTRSSDSTTAASVDHPRPSRHVLPRARARGRARTHRAEAGRVAGAAGRRRSQPARLPRLARRRRA